MEKTACFIGHRKIEETEELEERIYHTVETLITERGVARFLFGSRSAFDDLCKGVVAELKKKYPEIKRVYVRAEFEYINKDYENYLLQGCEETYFPKKVSKAGKAAYIERNQIMIKQSEYCVFYYNEAYLPPKEKSGGTKIAYDYAVRKKKRIINLYQ